MCFDVVVDIWSCMLWIPVPRQLSLCSFSKYFQTYTCRDQDLLLLLQAIFISILPHKTILLVHVLTFWHRSFTCNSKKSPTWCNNFSVYYPDLCLQLNMFRAFFCPSSGAQWLQWQPLILPSYRGDSRAVFVVGPAGRWWAGKRPKHVEL